MQPPPTLRDMIAAHFSLREDDVEDRRRLDQIMRMLEDVRSNSWGNGWVLKQNGQITRAGFEATFPDRPMSGRRT